MEKNTRKYMGDNYVGDSTHVCGLDQMSKCIEPLVKVVCGLGNSLLF